MEFGMGGTATVDPAAGTVFSANLPAFTNVMSLVQDGMDNVYLDNVGVVRASKVEYDKPAQPVTIARLVNNAGEDIDVGVPVDVDLLERAGSKKEKRTVDFKGQRLEAEIHDYSSFFDLENLSQVMNELYGTARTT